jgi:hypothetical protein
MQKNAVVGVSVNFDQHQLKNFILSFRENNKIDDIILFVDAINLLILKECFIDYNVIFKTYNFYEFVETPVHNTRYIKYLEFLSDCTEYKHIFLSDTKDVIFQANPFENLPDEFLYLFKEDSNVKIADDYYYNSWWIYSAYGQDMLNTIGGNNIICSGTILGSYNEIIKLLALVKEEFTKIKKDKLDVFKNTILDQAIINYLGYMILHDNKNVTFKPNGDVIGTLGATVGAVPKDDGSFPVTDSILMNGYSIMINSMIPSIIHQYDRHAGLKSLFDNRYQL